MTGNIVACPVALLKDVVDSVRRPEQAALWHRAAGSTPRVVVSSQWLLSVPLIQLDDSGEPPLQATDPSYQLRAPSEAAELGWYFWGLARRFFAHYGVGRKRILRHPRSDFRIKARRAVAS